MTSAELPFVRTVHKTTFVIQVNSSSQIYLAGLHLKDKANFKQILILVSVTFYN